MAHSVLRVKSKEFAKDIVFLCRKMKKDGVEGALIKQLFNIKQKCSAFDGRAFFIGIKF